MPLKTFLGILVIVSYFIFAVEVAADPGRQPEDPIIPNRGGEFNNNSGENDGAEQDGSLNTNNQNSTVNSNNTTNSKTYNGAGSSGMPVYSAISPSYMSTGPETCFRGNSQGIQTATIGFSRGGYREDPECNRRRDAKVLSDLGMKVAAVARMCQNAEVWRAMFISGTPCPVLQGGKLVVGKRAYLALKSRPSLHIHDYSKKKDWYNDVLGIGVENESTEGSDTRSISERFRSSERGSTE